MSLQPADGREGAQESAVEAVALAQRQLDRGEPLLAYNAAQEGLERWPDQVRLRQLRALALARSGDTERANQLLSKLADEGLQDAETLGMLARTHKDLSLQVPNAAQRAVHLEAGFRLYERAFESSRDAGALAEAWYAGINAATMAVLMDDLARARAIAGEVLRICDRGASEAQSGMSRYWREATRGEAALILGEGPAAARHYAEALSLAGERYADVSTTRRQARLLAAHLPKTEIDVEGLLRIPPVVAFTGSMIDQADRPAPRFPATLQGRVREAIREQLVALRPLAVYGSAACGADILCLEVARELGAETHVVLPFPAAEFRRISVDFAAGDWAQRFEQAMTAADSVTVTSDHRASGSAATFEYANLVLTGMARLRAQVLDTAVRGLAVWDPGAPLLSGGTASLVSLWERHGLAIDQVHLAKLRGATPETTNAVDGPAGEAPPAGLTRHEMRALLFADAVGYSQLDEDQIPRYISGFLGAVAQLSRRTAHPFEHVETSGDGLYMVFGSVADAGHYALELNQLTNSLDRAACGLPESFTLRIALHCGPVHCGRDPITGSPMFTGPHTSRAARIEPITPPGQVYASSAFAAVAAASGTQGFVMHYVGRIPLAKRHGTLGLYNLRPTPG